MCKRHGLCSRPSHNRLRVRRRGWSNREISRSRSRGTNMGGIGIRIPIITARHTRTRPITAHPTRVRSSPFPIRIDPTNPNPTHIHNHHPLPLSLSFPFSFPLPFPLLLHPRFHPSKNAQITLVHKKATALGHLELQVRLWQRKPLYRHEETQSRNRRFRIPIRRINQHLQRPRTDTGGRSRGRRRSECRRGVRV